MTEEERTGATSPERQPKPQERYEPPAIEWEEDYGETFGMASACNKVTISEAGCDTGTTS